jgi:hypothetical protein
MSNLQISIKFIPKKVFYENLNPQPIFYPKAKIKEADSNLIFDTASFNLFVLKVMILM